MAHPSGHTNKAHHKAKSLMRKHGYAVGGRPHSDEAADKKLVAMGIHKHEKHDHPGKPLTKLKDGGYAKGGMPKARADRKGRHHGPKININIVHPAAGGAPPIGLMPRRPTPMPVGAMMGGPRPAMPPMGPGANPGLPPSPISPPMKRGGKTKAHKHAAGGKVKRHKTHKRDMGGMTPAGGGVPSLPPAVMQALMAKAQQGQQPGQPPMPMGQGQMPPPGGMPMRPPGMKRGGKIHMTAGAGSGEGRLEKAAFEKSHMTKKMGK